MSKSIVFDTQGIRYTFFDSGDLCEIVSSGSDLINSMIPGAADGGIGELVLRIYDANNKPTVYPLTGRDANYVFHACAEGLCFSSRCGTVEADVCFLPGPEGWLWRVFLNGSCEAFDLLYMQDIGLAEISAQRTNELYTAQYLAHHAISGPCGTIIASRQNLPQSGRHPCLWQGSPDTEIVSFSTDGTQYFGNSYCENRIPSARDAGLPGTVLQGESACIALQTKQLSLNGSRTCTFFAMYQADHPDVFGRNETSETEKLLTLTACDDAVRRAPIMKQTHRKPVALYVSPEMTDEELTCRYPKRELEEKDDSGHLLSFFQEDHVHVVLRRKELLCERPHGTILTTLFRTDRLPDNLLTSTAYMYGSFACQTVVGNTSFHKLNSVSRGRYDWLGLSGTRIQLRLNGQWVQLGIPSLFEMDFHSARWVYILPEDELQVCVWMGAEAPGMKLNVKSVRGKNYEFRLTMQAVLGDNEFCKPFDLQTENGKIFLRMSRETFCRYPSLYYSITPNRAFTLLHDEPFFEDGTVHDDSLLTFAFPEGNGFSAEIHADLYGETHSSVRSFEEEKSAYHQAYSDFLGGLSLSIAQDMDTARRINHTAFWFLHNAMVHFCVPHGLEQSGGAAWGTRDVCQGPLELMMATEHYSLARQILLRVFANQNPDGDWPQWFMFDRYSEIRAGESHGDIVFWPLKALGDYLSRTGDIGVLSETVHSANGNEEHTLEALLLLSVGLIESRFISGTDFLQYGNGDWDDTLQPANRELRKHMSSAWTQALAYQTMSLYTGDSLPEEITVRCSEIAQRLKKGFSAMMKEGYIPGFILTDEKGAMRTMIDPQDSRTGIHFRLIPYTRVILSGLADSATSDRFLDLIHDHLLASDGARLLDRPTHYSGGNSTVFLRAEQAANIGREISLQYLHAHIRYTYALAKCKKASQTWNALLQAAPPRISDSVPNAMPRQSNVYFTSSDADLPDRASFEKHYTDVMRGDIPVKGGWRLYSSGPGIWLALLLDNILSLHAHKPVIPDEYDGLTVTLCRNGNKQKLVFNANAKQYELHADGMD